VRGAIGKAVVVLRDSTIGWTCGSRSAAEIPVEEVAADRALAHNSRCLHNCVHHGLCFLLCLAGGSEDELSRARL
jgi:hypothetical protein